MSRCVPAPWCFATGRVTGPAGLPVGGFVGLVDSKARIVNCYCRETPDASSKGVAKLYPESGAAECEPVTEIGADVFKSGAALGSWDFENTWNWNGDTTASFYPRLRR